MVETKLEAVHKGVESFLKENSYFHLPSLVDERTWGPANTDLARGQSWSWSRNILVWKCSFRIDFTPLGLCYLVWIYIWATQIRLAMQLLGCSIYSQMWARTQALHRSVRWLLWCATKVIKEDLNWNCLHYAASSEHYMHALFALARYSRRTYFYKLEGGPANIISNF